ncbi:MAG: hypothetical protein CMG13_02810 [Candidatus Marinimicrobia bacterium]|nr:hypothetical protein [Candidatus Neomarinimicrobiota bacterium]|tara:strand:- start:1839 stop:3092 length:1254 start_codon:yes stop_codon:yes gene_type:complete
MLKNNLKYSIIEGSFFAFMFGLGENYLSALGVFLGYTALQISILSSLPQLAGAFIQLASNNFAKIFKSMKALVVFLSLIQTVMWIFLIVIISSTNNYFILLLWSVVYFSVASAMGPVWISWIGYLVPKRIRSNYHASRNKIINTLIFASILLGGIILKVFENNMILAFSIMFGIGAIGRLFSSYYLNKKEDAGNTDDGDAYTYKSIIKSKTKLLFVVYNTSIHFSVMFLGPLFTIYILRTMELSYMVLTLCMAAWWVGNISSSKFWGRLGKKKGNLYLLKLSTVSMVVLPILWISVYYFDEQGRILISLIINVLAGVTFAGFGLSSFNIVFEISDKKEVVKYSSLINCLKGVAIFAGSVIAGSIVDSNWIIDFTSKYSFTSIQFSMIISTILRFFSYLALFKFEREYCERNSREISI